eukprot:SAG11_NODE_7755_length_1099_cov_1.933067_1_plen_278_part_00
MALPAQECYAVFSKINSIAAALATAAGAPYYVEFSTGRTTKQRPAEQEAAARARARSAQATHGFPSGSRCAVVYCADTAWLYPGTVRENILFGAAYDAERYAEAVDAACLADDFRAWGAAGDCTVLAKRGATLSGGQRQRVALARAVYSDTPIAVLDNMLAALDNATARRCFERAVGVMRRRGVVLLATHQTRWLETAERVLLCTDARHEGGVRIGGLAVRELSCAPAERAAVVRQLLHTSEAQTAAAAHAVDVDELAEAEGSRGAEMEGASRLRML